MRAARAIVPGIAIVLAGLFAEAAAQQASFVDKVSAPAQACMTSRGSTAGPDQVIAVCQQAFADVAALRSATPDATQHDLNAAHMVRSYLSTQIAGQYLKIDGVRSSRVCAQEETSWAELSGIVDSASPEGWRKQFAELRESAVAPVAKCRSEMGTPPGAPPLPPG